MFKDVILLRGFNAYNDEEEDDDSNPIDESCIRENLQDLNSK